jgi:hypothetical protein
MELSLHSRAVTMLPLRQDGYLTQGQFLLSFVHVCIQGVRENLTMILPQYVSLSAGMNCLLSDLVLRLALWQTDGRLERDNVCLSV